MFFPLWLKIKIKNVSSRNCCKWLFLTVYPFTFSIAFVCLSWKSPPFQDHIATTGHLCMCVDDRHLKSLWQVSSHCFCWSDEKHIAKERAGLEFLRINLKHPFKMRIATKKHFGKRWGWGEQFFRWKYGSVKQMCFFNGDCTYCALTDASFLRSLESFSAPIRMLAPGSPEENQWKQLHACSWWTISIYFKIRNESLLETKKY